MRKYTGDSFRDLTRIARINDKMWAELFLWNKENLISEIDQFSGALNEMRNALVADDREKLEEMFRLSTQRRAALLIRKRRNLFSTQHCCFSNSPAGELESRLRGLAQHEKVVYPNAQTGRPEIQAAGAIAHF